MNILALGKGNNRVLLEQACTTVCADQLRPISYTAIKHQITAIRAHAKQRPTTIQDDQPAITLVGPRDTSRAHLTGIDQFRLNALTSTNKD